MKRISELRKEKNWNQMALGLKINVSQKMISAYENGVHEPSIETLINMSKLFDVSIDYIVGNSDTRFHTDRFLGNILSDNEIQCIEMFKTLSKKQQQMALGIIFALKHMD